MTTFKLRFLALGLVVIGALTLATYFSRHRGIELPKYGTVPPFSLTERSGRTVTNADLAGKVWIADFIFTMCPGPCPLISANMAKLQNKLAGDDHVRLVSFTVDPQDDTPAVLSAYADAHKADPERWLFLTGDQKSLYDLIQHGFYQAVQDNHGKALEPGQFLVTHSTRVVLVDKNGVMRGFYDGLGGDGNPDLLAALRELEDEEF